MPYNTINILVLEDNEHDIEFIDKCIQELNIEKAEYAIFSTRDSFLDVLGFSIHIVILDHIVGLENAYAIFQEIRRRNEGTWTIILTGWDSKDVILLYMNHDADRFVSKNDNEWREQLKSFLQEGFKEAKKNIEWMNWLKTKKLENDQRTD